MERWEIERHLSHLSEALGRRNVVGEIVLFGGVAMVLAHAARVSTKDATLRTISIEWNEALNRGQPLTMWRLGDLADDFRLRASTAGGKLALVSETPVWIDDPREANCNAYWAAVAETLCREAGLTPPEWTESARCYLRRPWFAGAMENLKAILLAESPVAFRRRNLFVSSNALARA